jgi:hypothetical protein
MRKYRHARNRVYSEANEPELQWVEDSCGILGQFAVLYVQMIVCGLCEIAYSLWLACVGVVTLFNKTKQRPKEIPQQITVFVLPPQPRTAIRAKQKRLPYITVKALPPQ